MIFQFHGDAKDSLCTVFSSAKPQGSRRCASSSTLGANGSAAASRLIKTQPYLSSTATADNLKELASNPLL
jgi:hypothetical protein